MVSQYFNKYKLPIIATVVGISIVSVVMVLWFIFKPDQHSAKAVPEPVRLEYCGAEPEQLCVLSFGRDEDGNTVINLYAPKKEIPAFYIKVSRAGGESLYECDRYQKIPTTVYCIGEPLNLNEGIEISVLSKTDDALLARGKFSVNAFLIATTTGGEQTVAVDTPSPAPTFSEEEQETPTPKTPFIVVEETPVTVTSYPNDYP